MFQKFLLTNLIELTYGFYVDITLIFGVVFFYQEFGYNIFLGLLPFAFGYLLYGILVIPIYPLIGKIGTKYSIVVALILFTIGTLISVPLKESNALASIFVWFLFFFIAKCFYNPAISTYYSQYSRKEFRGKEFGFREATLITGGVLTPIVGGVISQQFGVSGLYIAGTIMAMFGLAPLITLNNFKFNTQFNFKSYFEKNRVDIALLNLSTESIFAVERVWPIFIFAILGNSFVGLGNFSGITTLLTLIFVALTGYLLDRYSRSKIFNFVYITHGFTLFLRIFSSNPFAAAFLDTLTKFSKRLTNESLQALNNDLICEDENLRDVNILVREVIVGVAIFLGTFFTGLLTQAFGFFFTFIVFGLLNVIFVIIKWAGWDREANN